jgi:membrane protein DedA with SNARE-associated domain
MVDTFERSVLSALQTIFDQFGWFGVFGLMIFENATGITPSEVVLAFAGWMLIEHHGISPAFIPLAGGFMALGSAIGASITYWVARIGGRPMIDRLVNFFRLDRQYIDRVEGQVHMWGMGIIFLGRLLPGIRTFINIPAGMAGIPFTKFFIATFFGAYVWCTILIGAGFMLGHEWMSVSGYIKSHIPLIVMIMILAAAAWSIYHHRIRLMRFLRPHSRQKQPDGSE